MVKVSDLPQKHLGIDLPEEPKEKPAATTEAPAEGAGEAAAPAAAAALTPEAREKIVRMQGDLRWLVREGYVTEFIDGRVFAPPPMVEARKKEVESEEHDPENFPEVPAETTAPATVAPSEDAPEAKEPDTSA
ncbi:MAG: hypothetical protein BWY57_03414 [Betaproteobacteria bacterium ADurb.Bin341]|nr:MAG: hypothetical protein BWY57_03414 [Betaproteobacteria bacterium ADurb.Bin341]